MELHHATHIALHGAGSSTTPHRYRSASAEVLQIFRTKPTEVRCVGMDLKACSGIDVPRTRMVRMIPPLV